MVKCNNPDCPVPVVSYPAGHNLSEVISNGTGGSDEAD